MTTIHPQKRREPVKTIDGHNFYQIENADEILYSRYIVAEVQELYIRNGISEGFLKEIANELVNRAMNPKSFESLRQDVLAIGQNLQGRVGFLADRKVYEQLACVYFMMDDEPAEFDEEWQRRKIAVWRSAGESDFFIIEAYKRINGSLDISSSDMLTVWQAVEERIAQLPNYRQS